jgi:hypothetical protein
MDFSGRLLNSRSGIGDRGSVLILVLWVLVLLGVLSAQHVAHNRDKASLAIDALARIEKEQTVQSVIELYRSAKTPFPEGAEGKGKWMVISINGKDVWTRWDKEGKRTLVDVANETKLRSLVRTILERKYPDGSEKELGLKSDELVDALLDWIDADDLRRLNGAEADDYLDQGLNYVPSDAPFRTMTEMLLVMGMSETLFWGEPISGLIEDLGKSADDAGLRWDDSAISRANTPETRRSRLGQEQPLERIADFWDAVTVYPKDVHRLTLIGTEPENGYWLAVVFMKAGGNRMEILEEIGLRFASNSWRQSLESLQAGSDSMKNALWKRYAVYDQ